MPIRPPILQRGDTVGIVTLGSPLDANIINARIEYLRAMEFNVVLGQYVYAQNGFLAGTDEQRASDLMMMFQDDQVKMILPTRGGTGVAGILPYLDYQVIRNHPKILTGYSDITVLLNALHQFVDLITFHSLLLIDFKPETPSYNYDQFFAATSLYSLTRPILNPPEMPLISRVPGNVTGPLVGGNLTSFVDTLGTPFEIDTRGKIIVLEETHEPTNTVYRYLNDLKLAGKFRDCIGIITGECTGCQAAYGKSYEDLINEFIVPLGKPLITNLATGHGLYKAALPIGALVNLDSILNTITVVEPTISA
ncbi:LD-carboxypeptidase [Paenibacillus glucanolyticus]|jgi:muramoyltetrapeptide carboxypeptidase|uniref:S66 peptidase family protein n=1 Tax=Paenibacillus TaxID=44249 RepID=UPI0003E24706|nr:MULTISPECIES: LD-carboxypeptidase [Paenibacillus]ANA78880.1 LD-carboxypeptidase [Paenibacillus glucanolyticus]AVV57205.1 LD-carboxypeptidase [Paenibacillus glucanolyticus]ETT32050.1 peptidase U61 LD-carboxypeptidase A [Paenibacillus sp. FSL R5-808]MPY16683.1 LD-carboxypeptidase [Paenibacillus glucanolyticus]OMF74536.1 LD-carboxypeptidase [Paenibacillus glucanolyticus]